MLTSIDLDTAPPLTHRKKFPFGGCKHVNSAKAEIRCRADVRYVSKDAAIKAGYSEKSARSKGSQLAKDPEVIAFISRKKQEVIETDAVPTYGKKVYTPSVNSPQKKRGL